MNSIDRQRFTISDMEVDCFGKLKLSSLLFFAQEVAGHHSELLGVGYDELWVVPAIEQKGYRAVVQGMEDKDIPVYKITKDKETGEYVLAGKTTVDYQKFHSEFTHKLGEESMRKILPLVAQESDDVTNDDIEEFFK